MKYINFKRYKLAAIFKKIDIKRYKLTTFLKNIDFDLKIALISGE